MALQKIHIEGFKSIRDQPVELRPLNVLIGANGAGKSNFIGVFKLLREILRENLEVYIPQTGGPERFLHHGLKTTGSLKLEFVFDQNAYSCILTPTPDQKLIFQEETVSFQGPRHDRPFSQSLGRGHFPRHNSWRSVGDSKGRRFRTMC